MKMHVSICCLALLSTCSVRAQYRVSEVYIPDDDGEPGWIEVKGKGRAESIGSYRLVLEDSKGRKIEWEFPPDATTGGDERIVVHCVGKDANVDGSIFAGFRLPRAGGTVRLLKDGFTEPVSETSLPDAWGAFSWGTQEGEEPAVWGYFLDSSPGKPNAGLWAPSPPAGAVLASSRGRLFSGNLTLTLSTESGKGKVRYTQDGERPSGAKAKDYAGPITLKTSTLLRACVVEKGKLPGPVWGAGFVRTDPALLGDFSSNLPLLVIDSHGIAVDEEWSPGKERPFRTASVFCFDTLVKGDGRSHLSAEADFSGRSGIHVRGQSSASYPKKQYALEFRDERDEDLNVRILDFQDESDFVLQGPYADKSLVRNVLAYETARVIGGSSAGVRTRFVELFFNQDGGDLTMDDYRGVYVLMERIKRDDERVPLKKLQPWDTEQERVSGGYLFKKDRAMKGSIITVKPSGHQLEMIYPKAPNSAQISYIEEELESFEESVRAGRPMGSVNRASYRVHIDVGSFIDNHILSEFFRNLDALKGSCYYHKDRGKPIRAFPVWDYNLSMGNIRARTADSYEGWQTFKPGTDQSIGFAEGWYDWLGYDDDAVIEYWDRYFQLRDTVLSNDHLLVRIDAYEGLLGEARSREFSRWPITGARLDVNLPGSSERITHAGEMKWLKNWLIRRGEWMDSEFPKPPKITKQEGESLRVAVGGGLAPGAAIYYTTDGTDPRRPAREIANEKEQSLVGPDSPCDVFTPSNGILTPGKEWNSDDPGNEGFWHHYGKQSEVELHSHVEPFGQNGGHAYERIEFTLTENSLREAVGKRILVRSRAGASFQLFLNGTRVHVRLRDSGVAAHGYQEELNHSVVEGDGGIPLLKTGRNVLGILWRGNLHARGTDWSVNLGLVKGDNVASIAQRLEGNSLEKVIKGGRYRFRAFDGKIWSAIGSYDVP